MYRTITDFLSDWQEESAATLKIFQPLEDDKLNTKVSENVRSLGRLAWHIVQTLTEMGARAGLFPEDKLEHTSIPLRAAEISQIYKAYSEELAANVKNLWANEMLHDKLNMYGEEWEKGRILSVLVKHQAHHRAQMTVIMRILGMKVPGIYGPSNEEWASFGMPAME